MHYIYNISSFGYDEDKWCLAMKKEKQNEQFGEYVESIEHFFTVFIRGIHFE